jgi:tetratricopeptide (TPR) repeat protein
MHVDPNHYRHTVIAERKSHLGEGLRVSFCTRLACIFLVLLLANGMTRDAAAQAPDGPRTVDLGIIVAPSRSDLEQVLKQLHAGMDFSVLAKERSVDATAVDGGYMGRVLPEQLRTELRDALQGCKTGDLTRIIELPSGFAILKILSKPPVLTDLNPKRISSLISTGAIRYGAWLSGQVEANAIMQQFPKPDGWNRDLPEVCRLRKESLSQARSDLRRALLDAEPKPEMDHDTTVDHINGHAALAQLFAYSGEMDDSIEEWKIAYQMAEREVPVFLPNLQESLGTAYLHRSEMYNGVYLDSTSLDIFPPLKDQAGYEKKDDSQQAIRYYEKYLKQNPKELEVRWLLNLAYMTLGQYPNGVPAEYRIPESAFRSAQNIGRFVDVAPSVGLNVVRGAGGLIVDDFENNGLLDVAVSSQDVCDSLRYFHNNGDGTFSDWTERAGLLDQLGGLNIVEADYNDDGCMDILVLRGGWEFAQRKSLLRNNCNGTFTDVTDASGLGVSITSSQTAVWADIDNDGYLDLFIGNENSPAQLFRNRGDGTFEEIGHAAGIDRTAFTKGVTAADYDQDGFVDFYVTNNNGVNFLYHNNGNKTFREVARQAGVQSPVFSFSTWFFDYDNDGWPDLFVTGYMNSIDEALKTYVKQPFNAETVKLYRNKHDGTFEDVTAKVGLDKVFMPMGTNFGDVDDDGYLDIYLGMGSPSYTALLPHTLLRNDRGKFFFDITQSSGTGELHKGHGIVFADLGRQGNEDILAEIGGAVPGDKHAMRVFKNPGNTNDWLNIRLVGVKSNRAAVGTQVKITIRDGNDVPRSIYRVVGQTSSFGGNPMEQHIGLGRGAHAITIDVFWPATRTRQQFSNLAKNQYIEIHEFAQDFIPLKRQPIRLGNGNLPAARSSESDDRAHMK